jgi:hypothetical protein
MEPDGVATVQEAERWEDEGWELADAIVWPRRVVVYLRRGDEREARFYHLGDSGPSAPAVYADWDRATLEVTKLAYEETNADIVAARDAWVHEDIEVAVDDALFPGLGGPRKGREEYGRYQDEIREAFADYGVEVHDVRRSGRQFLVTGRAVGRGRDSGAEVSIPLWHLWTVRDGRPIHLEVHAEQGVAEAAFRGRS